MLVIDHMSLTAETYTIAILKKITNEIINIVITMHLKTTLFVCLFVWGLVKFGLVVLENKIFKFR